MPEDYWSSQAATLAERSIGYDEGASAVPAAGADQAPDRDADD